MKFLLDENLSPLLRDLLVESGHDVIHVRDLQMAGSTDEVVIAQAATLGRVLISADTDFGAHRRSRRRRNSHPTPADMSVLADDWAPNEPLGRLRNP